MTNRYPLIIDAQTQRIRELPSGDNLDLTGNGISAVRDILPETTSTYDLGSNLKRWKDLYLSGNSIFLGEGIISYDDNLKKFTFSEEIDGVTSNVSISLEGNTTDDLLEGSANLYYEDDRARSAISVSNLGGDGSLSYDDQTGVISYQGPTAEEVRAHFSAGTGVSITNGSISIGQSVSITDDVRFNSLQIDTDLSVDGNVTIGGNITLGNEVLDSVTVVADFTSNLIPNESNQFDLGSVSKKWRDLYVRSANIRQSLKLGTDNEETVNLTTDALSVNIFNDTATSINFAGAGTTIFIGASTGTTTVNHNLAVTGSISSTEGMVLSSGTNVDQIKTYTKSITLTQHWQDTGIDSTDLATGTYVVQLYANDISAGGTNNNEYYSGIMSWYAGNTGSSVELPTDEIILHRAGASSDAGMYLRTLRVEDDILKLQIYSNVSNPSASNYVFKFRRII